MNRVPVYPMCTETDAQKKDGVRTPSRPAYGDPIGSDVHADAPRNRTPVGSFERIATRESLGAPSPALAGRGTETHGVRVLTVHRFGRPDEEPSGDETATLPYAFWQRWTDLGRSRGSVVVWGAFLPDPDPRPHFEKPRCPAVVRLGSPAIRKRFFHVRLRAPLPARVPVAELESLFVALANELDAAARHPEPGEDT